MREYGEKLGMEWNESLYVKWNYNTKTYTHKGTFNFPKTVGYNDDCIVGKALYDYLVVRNFDDTYKAYIAPFGATWADCSGFKVETWHDPNDDRDWDFYVLLG